MPPSAQERQRLREGVAAFNRGEFFEAHELLEEIWLPHALGSPPRVFLQALIQTAVGFFHWERGKLPQAAKQFERARLKFESLEREAFWGFAISPIVAEIRAAEAGLSSTPEAIYRFEIEPPDA